MIRNALIAAALLALVLCGCSSQEPKEMIDMFARMESKIDKLKSELVEVKAMVVELKSELSTCKGEMQALIQENLQEEEAEAAAEIVLEEAPVLPEHPSDHPVKKVE